MYRIVRELRNVRNFERTEERLMTTKLLFKDAQLKNLC